MAGATSAPLRVFLARKGKLYLYLLLLLLLPLCSVFTNIYLKQTILLGCIVLQLFVVTIYGICNATRVLNDYYYYYYYYKPLGRVSFNIEVKYLVFWPCRLIVGQNTSWCF